MRSYTHRTIVKLFCLTLYFNFFTSNWVFAQSESNNELLTDKISRNYLRSFTVVPPHAKPLSSKTMKETMRQTHNITLAETTQRKIALRTIFSEIAANKSSIGSSVLNDNAWNDLILFFGSTSHPAYHLLSRINRTNTVLGECALATMLVTPTSDIATLANRQQTLQLLLEQPTPFLALKQSLANYKKIEQHLLSLWTDTDPLYTHAYKSYMNKRFLSTNSTNNKKASKLNLKVFFRNFSDIYSEFIKIPAIGLFWCEASHLLMSISRGGMFQGDRSSAYAPFPLFVPFFSMTHVVSNYKKVNSKPSLLPFLGVTATHGLAIWRGYCAVKNYEEYSAVFKNLASRMQDVQVFMKTIEKLSAIVKGNHSLEANYAPSLSAIRSLLAKQNESTDIGVMVRNFLEMRFDNWSYIYGNSGKLLATYSLFTEYRDCLKMPMYELGQLDSFVGIATLLQEAKKAFPGHCYTFTKFLDRSTQKKPCVHLDAMWNPMLNPATVVDNTIQLDADKTRNMILSGPNAGGKSSFISGVATNLLLSQTFGIAAAKSAVITPFNKLNTFIELKDDIASGASLFMVEVARMQQYIHMLENSKPDDFIFTISDEPLARTNPLEASAAAYGILAAIAQYTNALHIVSTHYPILMTLSSNFKERGIRNFKVFIDEKPDRNLHYTYKIVPGEADQTTALKILEKEGYDQELIKQAQDIVNHSEKFPLLNYFKKKGKKKS